MPTPAPNPQPAVIELIEAAIPSRLAPATESMAGVNWTVRQGEFWVLGGLQGSGKSDLLFAAAGLSQPLRGSCRLFGRETGPVYSAEDQAGRLRVGLVFGEGGRLFAELTVQENVSLPLLYHQPAAMADIPARVGALLRETGLEEMGGRVPAGLNPTWRQRAALARALALQPEILLLDNPLAGMDPRHARWWFQFLNQLSMGHPLLNGCPATLVVAVDDFRPWIHPGRRYALLAETRLQCLDDPTDPGAQDHQPALRELLAAHPHSI
jgi:ABC-type transporter Mla maintaining outer membrane lipid asymmetry ATPase subunit MlaF